MMDAPVFISYGRDDETADFVPRLHDDLENAQFSAWLDVRDVVGNFRRDIDSGLYRCWALIFVVTRKSLDSDECLAEWNDAISKNKPVIPVLWGKGLSFSDLPSRLKLLDGIDFRQDYDQALSKLLRKLRLFHTPEGKVEQAKTQVEILKQGQAESPTPERFDIPIEEAQKLLAYFTRVLHEPEKVKQEEQASLQASIEREQQKQTREAEQRQMRVFLRVVGFAPQDVKNKFKDRASERSNLKTWFTDDNMPLMVVVGHGGMGKTALTCYVMDELNDDYEKVAGLIYLSTTTGGVDLEKVFLSVGQMTGHESGMIEAYNDAQTPLAGRIQKLLDVLRREDNKRYILLLDNFESLQNTDDGALTDADLQEFLNLMLQQRHPLKILITTRIPLKIAPNVRTRAQTLRLEAGLPAEEAAQVLRDLGVDGAEPKLRELAERLHGYPRALEAAAAYLSDPFITLDDLLARQDIFYIEVDEKKLIDNMVRAALTSLAPEALRVMQALAVVDRPVPEAAVKYMLEPFMPLEVVQNQLQRLTRIHLITYDSGRYSLHPVDQAFAYNALPSGSFEDVQESWVSEIPRYTRAILAARAADYFKTTRLAPEKWKTIQDLEPQLAEFEQRIKAGSYDEAARLVRDIDFDYLMVWGHSHKVIEMREQLLDRLTDEDLTGVNYWHLALAYKKIGSIRLCIEYNEKALDIYRKRGSQEDIEKLLGNLGLAYSDLGNFRRAIECHEQALAIAREIGDQQRESVCLSRLGTAHGDLGDMHRSIEYHEMSLAITQKIGDKNRESDQLNEIGYAYGRLGDSRRSIVFHEQALAIARSIPDKVSEGTSLHNLGLAYRDVGDLQSAVANHEQSLAIARETGNRYLESLRLGTLGDDYAQFDLYDRAIDYHEQALKVAREIGDRREEGIRLGILANVYRNQGEVRQAITYCEQALEVVREVGDRANEMHTLTELGDTHASIGQQSGAIRSYEQALAVVRVIGDKVNEGKVLSALGEVYREQGDFARARQYYERIGTLGLEIDNKLLTCIGAAAMGLLAMSEGKLPDAIRQFEQAMRIADQIDQFLFQFYMRAMLILGRLYENKLSEAATLIEEAQQFNTGQDGAFIGITGIVYRRQGNTTDAQQNFRQMLQQLDDRLMRTPELYGAWYGKGMALAGLAVCSPHPAPDFIEQAKAAYQEARRIFAGAGVVNDNLMLLDELRKCEGVGTQLDEVRRVLAGED